VNLANKITLLRLALVPVFVGLLYFEGFWPYTFALVVFIAAVITDYYDGKIARERGIVTSFGKLMDPVADKVLVAAAFVMFVKIDYVYVPAWAVIIILTREFLITGLRALAAVEGIVIPAERLGKHKAGWQMGCIITTLGLMVLREVVLASSWCPANYAIGFERFMQITVFVLMIIVVVLTVLSGASHLRKNWGFFFGQGAT